MTVRIVRRVCILLLVAAVPAGAAPADGRASIDRGEDQVTVGLPGGVVLTFALCDGFLLGLNRAQVDGVDLTSPDTCLRPTLAQEFGEDRMAWPLMRFTHARALDGGAVEIECELLGTGDERAYRNLFVFTGDADRALAPENMTPELEALKTKAGAAEEELHKACMADSQYAELQKQCDELDAACAKALDETAKLGTERDLSKALARLRKRREALSPGLLAESEALRQGERDVRAFREALDEASLRFGRIHRDAYRLAHLRLPAEICARGFLEAQARDLHDACTPAGTLVWVVEPVQRNVAGWRWAGWRQSYRFALPEGRKVNVLRQVGTWELGGRPDGATLVNLRYRGLGRIEQALTAAGPGKGVREAFTTTEIMPGAVEGSYLVSPVIPKTDVKELSDRGYALAHRVGAWIGHMARGAGHGFVDFQYRPEAGLASFPERQGSLRALTEVFPGDAVVSQTDVEFFAASPRHETIPCVYLALVMKDQPLAVHEWRSRWQEVDQYVRDLVAEELRFVQFEALPGVGILSDNGWAGYYKGLAEKGLDAWADKGVRMVAYHNPGWVNGRYQGPGGPPKTGGGVCNIYDWWPTKDVEEPWKAFMRACGRRGVAYYPWLGQTTWRNAPFVERVGLESRHWSLNTPDDTHGPGYGPMNMKGNIRDARFREVFLGQLERLRHECGYQGFWADSFQNLFMSQLDWAGGTGDSLQRAWWEQIAAWTREGVGWMAESHAFPGLSCSIEVADWEKDTWFFQHVWKWLRGNAQAAYRPEELDRLCFRIMASKGWLAPDHSYKTHADFAIPAFERLAHEYLAALPAMRRSYVLADERGMLWLPFSSDDEGVWFAFAGGDVPEGVKAAYVLDEAARPVSSAEANRTYAVKADDLLARFGVRRGPVDDPRLGRTCREPAYTWPGWARP